MENLLQITVFPFIKGLLMGRLLTTHNYNFLANTEKPRPKKEIENQKFWVYYSLVTLTIVIIGVLVVVLFIYNYGLNIYTSLEYRKNFIEIPLNRRICVVKMPFNVVDKLSPKFKIEYFCNNTSNFGSYLTEHLKVQNELIRLRTRFYEKEIYNNVPSESWKIIFESFESDEDFIKLGITSALTFLRQETFLYWTNPKIYNLTNIANYISTCHQMALCFSEVLLRTENATNKVIDENFRSIIIYAITSIIFQILISIAIYVAYFRKEINNIVSIRQTLLFLLECENKSIKNFLD